jgi:WD40 repeat protein
MLAPLACLLFAAGPPAPDLPLPEGAVRRMAVGWNVTPLHGRIVFSPGGGLAVTSDQRGTVTLWSAHSGRRLRVFTGPGAASFFPDGKGVLLVSPGLIRAVSLDGKERWRYEGKGFTHAAFADKGKAAVVLGRDRIQLDAASGRQTEKAELPARPVDSLLQADLARYVAFTEKKATLHETATGEAVRSFDVGTGVSGATISPDGSRLGYNERGGVGAIELATGRRTRIEVPKRSAIMGFTPDGKGLLVRIDPNELSLYDARSGRRQVRYLRGAGWNIIGHAFTPDGTRLAVQFANTGAVCFETLTGERIDPSGGGALWSLAIAPDGKSVYACGETPVVRRWEVATGRLLRSYRVPPEGRVWLTGVAVSPDGKQVAATPGIDPSDVFVWDADTGRVVHRFPDGEKERSILGKLAFGPGGKTLLRSGLSPGVSRWDMATGKRLPSIRGADKEVRRFLPGPDGKTTLAASPFGLREWDGDGKEVRGWATGPKFFPSDIVPLPSGKLVVAAGVVGPISIRDAFTGKEVRSWPCEPEVQRLACSPDGKHLAIGGGESLRIHDIATGRELAAVGVAHLFGMTDLAFTRGGHLITAGANGEILVWDLTKLLRAGKK